MQLWALSYAAYHDEPSPPGEKPDCLYDLVATMACGAAHDTRFVWRPVRVDVKQVGDCDAESQARYENAHRTFLDGRLGFELRVLEAAETTPECNMWALSADEFDWCDAEWKARFRSLLGMQRVAEAPAEG